MTPDTWDTIGRLVAWLDSNSTVSPEAEIVMRTVAKLSEEVGEVAQAVIGVLGQNPRKGITHTWDDVDAELCDVIMTAMVALRTRRPDAGEVFAKRLAYVAERSLPTDQTA
ncbi:MazG-like family protein [Kitasatospora sp. NPDC004614]|uniref:MazG-like family protein n=1 Tax=unclassified Kitasatospora TaxID=2633591 RepID=UPI0036B1708A